jgi:hypothetical protein
MHNEMFQTKNILQDNHSSENRMSTAPAEGFRNANPSAGMPMNRAFARRLKLLKDFFGYSP